jgi:hypothetical protein
MLMGSLLAREWRDAIASNAAEELETSSSSLCSVDYNYSNFIYIGMITHCLLDQHVIYRPIFDYTFKSIISA